MPSQSLRLPAHVAARHAFLGTRSGPVPVRVGVPVFVPVHPRTLEVPA